MEPKQDKGTPKEVWNAHNVASRVKAGGTLYVKTFAAALKVDITPTADSITVLFPGDAVTWHGPHETDKRWHKVSATIYRVIPNEYHSNINPPPGTRVTGYIFGSNLSTTPPDMTLRAKEGVKQINPIAYPTYGQAVKG
jgi:hypothetical protein